MAIDIDQIDEVREALAAADSVDARSINVIADGDTVVLQGSVATFEQSAAAQQIAQEHAESVRNDLHIDHNLREGAGDDREVVSDSVHDARRREELRGSSYDPLEEADDVVTDVQESLDENRPWDPPHEAVEVPTRAEARGVADRRAADPEQDEDALLDDRPASAEKSLPDLSPEELARAAHPEHREEDR